MLKITIIGYGFVGKSMRTVFEHNAEFSIVDPAYSSTTIDDIPALDPQVVFICLPAPTLDDNTVDISLISQVFSELQNIGYNGLVVLKSTIPPAAAVSFADYSLKYVYSPEFIRQTTWAYDAVNPQSVIFAGAYDDCIALKQLYVRHSHLSKDMSYYTTDYMSAALAKYAINTFLAAKVVFMNQLHQLHSDVFGDDLRQWGRFTDLLMADTRLGNTHMDVPGPDGLYGYGGACFPKDVRAMIGFDKNNRLSLLREAELSNTKIRLS